MSSHRTEIIFQGASFNVMQVVTSCKTAATCNNGEIKTEEGLGKGNEQDSGGLMPGVEPQPYEYVTNSTEHDVLFRSAP